MIEIRGAAAVCVLLLGVTGCADDSSATPTHEDSRERDVKEDLTWQEAKARTQAMEMEIADSLPEGTVATVDQLPTGLLMDCDDTSVNWHGATTVALVAGTDPDGVVRELVSKYRDSRFIIHIRDPAPAGHYELQLRSPDTAEIYIIGGGIGPDTIRIASGSECFTWVDDGQYKRGEF